jgi:hypothetical protein
VASSKLGCVYATRGRQQVFSGVPFLTLVFVLFVGRSTAPYLLLLFRFYRWLKKPSTRLEIPGKMPRLCASQTARAPARNIYICVLHTCDVSETFYSSSYLQVLFLQMANKSEHSSRNSWNKSRGSVHLRPQEHPQGIYTCKLYTCDVSETFYSSYPRSRPVCFRLY